MSFIPKNPITAPEIKTTPSPPVRGTRGLFPMADGWYDIDFNGNFKRIALGEAKSPYIGNNGNWYTFNPDTQTFEDSGNSSKGEKGDSYILTESDKTEIINNILNSLPSAEGVGF